LNSKFDKEVDGIVDKYENEVKVTYMTEINTLKDEIKMRNKILDDNKMEIHDLKHSLQNQTELKEAYHKMETDYKAAQHNKEKTLHELREIQHESDITKRAIDDYKDICESLKLKVKSLKGEKTTLESDLNELRGK
jgi:predicted  nucleic acid-binding Zn-ribbon protein